jgi:hypothetical protein
MIDIQKVKNKRNNIIVTAGIILNLAAIGVAVYDHFKPTMVMSWGDRVDAISMAQDLVNRNPDALGDSSVLTEFLDNCFDKTCVVKPHRRGEEANLTTSKDLGEAILARRIDISTPVEPVKPGLFGLGLGIL